MHHLPSHDPDELLGVKALAARLHTSESTVRRSVAAGRLPKPVYVSPKSPRWRWGTVVEHLQKQTEVAA